jgi:hypothetical protein
MSRSLFTTCNASSALRFFLPAVIAVAAIGLCVPVAAEQLIFADNFDDGVITDKWLVPSTGLDVVDGRVRSTENGRLLQSLQTFTGPLRLEFDVEKQGSSNLACWDIAAGFRDPENMRAWAVLRFDHLGVDAVGMGTTVNAICNGAPTTTTSGNAPNIGHMIITYQAPTLSFTFENLNGQVLHAPSLTVGISEPFQIYINIAAHADSPRFIDNVELYSLDDPNQPGDTNADGRVDLEDLNNVRNHFGEAGPGIPGDADGNGQVTLVDLNLVRNHFGSAAGSAAVPEPSSLGLLVAATACAASLFRRMIRLENPGDQALSG